MAEFKLADLFEPKQYAEYQFIGDAEKSPIGTSGILVNSPTLAESMVAGGRTPSFPFYDGDLTNITINSADDTGGDSTPDKLDNQDQTAIVLTRNAHLGVSNIAAMLAGAGNDPARHFREVFTRRFTKDRDETILAVLAGIFADNDANDSSDMTYDATSSSQTSINDTNLLLAADTMGEYSDDLALMFMHSRVATKLKIQDRTDFQRGGDQGFAFRSGVYAGYQVVITDRMPVSGSIYDTYLVGRGALAFAQVPHKKPIGLPDTERSNNGDGAEEVIARVKYCLHPNGYSWSAASTPQSPTNAATTNNLAHAASWNRVYDKGHIKIARLKTNEAVL